MMERYDMTLMEYLNDVYTKTERGDDLAFLEWLQKLGPDEVVELAEKWGSGRYAAGITRGQQLGAQAMGMAFKAIRGPYEI